MRNGASDTLYRYQGEGLDFDQLMELFVAQVGEELSPFPDNAGDELDEDMRKINAGLTKSAKEMEEGKAIALEIYDRCETESLAATEMQSYEGNEWVAIIGKALEGNDWSLVAI